ncbi:MAG: enoyl-CoA hydratase/isomerase family protein [Candidatus Hydrogenedentes bacterium]|nr:enoyl-CoA hydratase/isomerase family protein [Candidatus Hydrogenedentota bacterium]
MTFTHLRLERMDRHCIITLNRPKANALSPDLIQELNAAFDSVEGDEGIRSIILTGGSGKFFCGGADIPSIREALEARYAENSPLETGASLMDRIERCPKPVIAAVNGFALGGGCELAMACHIRIASDEAMFGQPEINLGIVPGWGGCHRLPRLIGESRALDWLLTGRMVGAKEALEAGLVSKVVTAEELMTTAAEIAALLSEKAPIALRSIIRAVHDRAVRPETGKSLEAEAVAETTASLDAREGMTAFLEKRPAHFLGK